MKISSAILTGMFLMGCLPDVDGVKEEVIREIEEGFSRCEEKINALAEEVAVCRTILENGEIINNNEGEDTNTSGGLRQ